MTRDTRHDISQYELECYELRIAEARNETELLNIEQEFNLGAPGESFEETGDRLWLDGHTDYATIYWMLVAKWRELP